MAKDLGFFWSVRIDIGAPWALIPYEGCSQSTIEGYNEHVRFGE